MCVGGGGGGGSDPLSPHLDLRMQREQRHTQDSHCDNYQSKQPLNPFKPNGISHSYQPISVLRVVGWYFSFFSHFDRTFCKPKLNQILLMGHCIVQCLI